MRPLVVRHPLGLLTSLADGIVVATGFFYDVTPVDVVLPPGFPELLAAIDGTPDVLTVVITDMQGAMNVVAGLEWTETN